MPAVSYKRIAVAAAFSPRFDAVLAEADRLAQSLDAQLCVLHAAEQSLEKERKFRAAFDSLGRSDSEVIWCEGESPSAALVGAAAKHGFDLLMAGALERETELRQFTGGVARELLRRSSCDLHLVPNPQESPCRQQHVAIVVDPGVGPANKAIEFARKFSPGIVTLLVLDNPFAAAIKVAQGGQGELDTTSLEPFANKVEALFNKVDVQVIRSNTGFSVCEAVQNLNPDCLLVEAPFQNGERRIPAPMDWLYQVVPSRLFVLQPADGA